MVTNGTPKEYGFEEVIFLSIRMVHTAFPGVGLIGVFHMQHDKKRLSSRRYRNRVRWCYNTSGTADNSPTTHDNYFQWLSCIILPVSGLGVAAVLFYRIKLKKPIKLLQAGTEHIRTNDLDFSIPAVSTDELGQICAAFETMRLELLKTNQALWRQAEERKRLNAAFAHDLRNPITVLKGSLKLLRNGTADEQAIDRLESYTLRIEQYVEAMSSIQRIEQMPVRVSEVVARTLRTELEETARLFAPALDIALSVPDMGTLQIDHGIFLNVAENLIGNAARFARTKVEITLAIEKDILFLSVVDDGPGFPAELIKSGPKPFGKVEENSEHFGMGLYSSSLLCQKHGGNLRLENSPAGAITTVSIQINFKP